MVKLKRKYKKITRQKIWKTILSGPLWSVRCGALLWWGCHYRGGILIYWLWCCCVPIPDLIAINWRLLINLVSLIGPVCQCMPVYGMAELKKVAILAIQDRGTLLESGEHFYQNTTHFFFLNFEMSCFMHFWDFFQAEHFRWLG